MRDIVHRLGDLHTVTVVSDRDRPNGKSLVDLDNLIDAASHGFEISGGKDLGLIAGKIIFDILPPVDSDKGRAVEWMLERLDMNHPSVLLIYFSDDVTDEAAFQALRGTGVCICVRGENDTRMTWADYTVKTLPKSVLFYQC